MDGLRVRGPSTGKAARRAVACMVLLLILSLAGPIVGTAQAQDEGQYFRDIGSLIAAAEVHVGEAAESILTCAASLVQCTANPMPIVVRLNASRDGLDGIRTTVLGLAVPARYRAAHGLVAQALSDSIGGVDLYVEGILSQSDTAILAGADLFSVGVGELAEAERLLAQNPPASPLLEILTILIVALGASVAVSVGLILWWVRRMRPKSPQEPPPNP